MKTETCTWCNGEGINLAYKGQVNCPKCTRCAGSGKILTTDELSTTGRRRKYLGPATTVVSTAETLDGPILTTESIPEKIHLDHKLPEINQPKRRGRPPKHA